MKLKLVVLKILLVLSVQGVVSCSGTYKHRMEFSPQEPLRIAVLPFRQIDANGQLIEEKGEILIDNIPVIYSERLESPAAVVRQMVMAELKKTSLDTVSPMLIDLDLPHRGMAYADGRFDLEKIFSVPARTFCREFLDCDAVLFGTIKKWDRDYYGIQSNNEVEIELKLVSAVSGKVLFKSSGEDSESRGFTKGPTGYSSLILEPLKGLDNELIEDLAQRIVSKIVEPLKVKKKVVDYTEPPPAIYAVSHDARDGLITPGSSLSVLMYGSEGAKAIFSIGNYLRHVPMEEVSPGHYVGEYWPLAEEHFDNQTIMVHLQDVDGRRSKLEVDAGAVTLKVADSSLKKSSKK